MAGLNASPSHPRLVFFGNARDIDAICAMFPGPASIASDDSVVPHRVRLMGKIGCGLVLITFCLIPGAFIFINELSVSEWGTAAFGLASVSCSVFILWRLVAPKEPVFLILDQDGFTVENGRVYQSHRWGDVRDFRLAGVIRGPHVSFKNRAASARIRVIFGLGEDWLRFYAAFHNQDLAALLNQWRELALRSQAA